MHERAHYPVCLESAIHIHKYSITKVTVMNGYANGLQCKQASDRSAGDVTGISERVSE